MALVAGVMASAIPRPSTSEVARNSQKLLPGVTVRNSAKPPAAMNSPVALTTRWPRRTESVAATGETTTKTTDIGNRASAAFRAS